MAHAGNRRRRGYCDRGFVLQETSTHSVYRLVRTVPLDNSGPFHFERVEDPLNLVNWPINALNAVGDCERIKEA